MARMGVKLYEGCFGVTRDKRVVGPLREFSAYNQPYFEHFGVEGWRSFRLDGTEVNRATRDRDIIRVFPTCAEAEAWLNRPPYLVRLGRRAGEALQIFLMGIGLGTIIVWFFGCTTTHRPHDRGQCTVEDGFHQHNQEEQ